MKYVISSLLAAVMMGIGFIIVPPANAAPPLILNVVIPLQSEQFVPCTNNGQGENVLISGDLHLIIIDTSQQQHFIGRVNSQSLIGVGQTTGTVYHWTLSQINVFPPNPTGAGVITFVVNILLVGQGTGANFHLHEVEHLTVNPDGTVTSAFDEPTLSCENPRAYCRVVLLGSKSSAASSKPFEFSMHFLHISLSCVSVRFSTFDKEDGVLRYFLAAACGTE